MPEQIQANTANQFDLKTHDFNRRGQLKSKAPYRMFLRGGTKYFERPVGSGNLWYENDEPAGRVEMIGEGKKATRSFDHEAAHKAYKAPLSGAEKLHFENEDLKSQNAILLAELEAVRAEQAQKSAAGATATASALAATQAPVKAPTAQAAVKTDGV